jgi:predicted nucleotidyltransferase
VSSLEQASLSPGERRALARFVALLHDDYGESVRSVWLYGSRARGEPPHADSDVDVLVITDGGSWWQDLERVNQLLWKAAEEEELRPFYFSAHVGDLDWLARRREIRSFYIHEVDRDKIVLAGEG